MLFLGENVVIYIIIEPIFYLLRQKTFKTMCHTMRSTMSRK